MNQVWFVHVLFLSAMIFTRIFQRKHYRILVNEEAAII